MTTKAQLYSLKMRASQQNAHISGAENIIPEDELQDYCVQLLQRALQHSKGKPDFINFKIEAVQPEEILTLPALPVHTISTDTPEAGMAAVRGQMQRLGLARIEEILQIWQQSYAMRGAMLLDADSLQRLEPEPERGVRATYMDAQNLPGALAAKRGKNHFNEALVLATKVAHHPNIVAELCISDDPDYDTGYIAAKEIGYVRITTLKPLGSSDGGRVFLFRGNQAELADCIDYLQHQKVLVQM